MGLLGFAYVVPDGTAGKNALKQSLDNLNIFRIEDSSHHYLKIYMLPI